MPLVTPTNIPAQPPAPLPTDDRVTFAGKSFSWVGSMEPTRVAFNLIATQTNTNAAYAHERANAANDSAILAGQKAGIATDAVTAVNQTVADILAAKDAIQAGPVASVMGRTGVVTGLVEQAATALAASVSLDTVKSSGFYKLSGAYSLSGVDVSNGQLIVSAGTAGSIFQIAAHPTNGNVACRSGDVASGTFSSWQRVLTDRVLAERLFGAGSIPAAYTINLSNGSIQQLTLATSSTITMPATRQNGDQCTLLLFQTGGASIAFSSNVRLPKGSSLPATASGDLLTISMVAMNDVWYAYIGAKHSL